MKRLGLPGIIDHHLSRHGLHKGLSWGWIGAIWLAHIVSQSDHRKLPVQAWVRQAHETIERISRLKICELDFTDDRLTLLLRRLSQPAICQGIEDDFFRIVMGLLIWNKCSCLAGFQLVTWRENWTQGQHGLDDGNPLGVR